MRTNQQSLPYVVLGPLKFRAFNLLLLFCYDITPFTAFCFYLNAIYRTDCEKSPEASLCSYPEANVTFSTGERVSTN